MLPAILLATLPTAASAQLTAGSEFRVNVYTTNNQKTPAVAVDGNGDFVVVWQSILQDRSSYGIFGRRFSAAGAAKGTEFLVNSYSPNSQAEPAIASDEVGDFVVVWQSLYRDGSDYGIFGRRFDASGTPRGTEFRVNAYTTDIQAAPAIASDQNGDFVVVWQSFSQDGSDYGIFGRRFNSSGAVLGSEFRVNSRTTASQAQPAIASARNGDFAVVWQSLDQDGGGYGVFGQRFDSSGTPRGTEFRVNSYTTSDQAAPSVALDANAAFVVVWQSQAQDGDGYGVFGKRFNSSGAPQGAEFRANTYTRDAQQAPAVASDGKRNFVVVWEGFGVTREGDGFDRSGYGVFGRLFNSSGTPQGTEFQVNTYTTFNQAAPAVSADPAGDFVVVWNSDKQDKSNYGIIAQRYGDLIFIDGFESGDLSRWSLATGS